MSNLQQQNYEIKIGLLQQIDQPILFQDPNVFYYGKDKTKKQNQDVYLNVYDIWSGNKYVDWTGLGAYHTTIEINYQEYSYGSHSSSESGITKQLPGSDENYKFKTSIKLGSTKQSQHEIDEIIEILEFDYIGCDYDLLKKNCNHFSQDFARNLLKDKSLDLPSYVFRSTNWIFCFRSCIPTRVLKGQSGENQSQLISEKDTIPQQNTNNNIELQIFNQDNKQEPEFPKLLPSPKNQINSSPMSLGKVKSAPNHIRKGKKKKSTFLKHKDSRLHNHKKIQKNQNELYMEEQEQDDELFDLPLMKNTSYTKTLPLKI